MGTLILLGSSKKGVVIILVDSFNGEHRRVSCVGRASGGSRPVVPLPASHVSFL